MGGGVGGGVAVLAGVEVWGMGVQGFRKGGRWKIMEYMELESGQLGGYKLGEGVGQEEEEQPKQSMQENAMTRDITLCAN